MLRLPFLLFLVLWGGAILCRPGRGCWGQGRATSFQGLQGTGHAGCELGCVLLAPEVEAPDLAGIAPLMEDGSGLVVFDTPDDGTVDNHLLVRLHLAANDSEGVGGGVVVDLDSAEGLGTGASREPTLIAVIIHHHGSPAGTDDRFAHGCAEGGRRARGECSRGAPDWKCKGAGLAPGSAQSLSGSRPIESSFLGRTWTGPGRVLARLRPPLL